MYRIAIVDDNETWCFVLAHLLRQEGYEVATFTDTYNFLREARYFDLALIDFLIPPRRHQTGTDGPDLIVKLKQQLAHPPILALISSFFLEDCLPQISDLCPQADAYLSKGMAATKLLQEIKQLLADRHGIDWFQNIPDSGLEGGLDSGLGWETAYQGTESRQSPASNQG